MAENPLYEQQIAPPSTTGEILDNQSLGLKIAKNQAEYATRRNAAGAFMQLAGTAETIGNIFTRKNDLSQQQQMLSDLQQLDSEIGSVPENGVGGTGQLGNLNQNRNLLAEWETQEGGAESEYFQSWSEARLNNLGQGLRGKWRDAFELEARNRLLKANMTIDSMATTHAYNGIKMANQEAMSTSIQNPNIDNIGSSIASSLGEMDGRLAIGIDAGIYTPQEAMEVLNNYENALLQSHYGAASRDIQDSDGWTDPTTGQFYNGLAGAEEMLGDHLENGDITEQQFSALRTQLYEADTAKYARGSKIQSQMTNKTYAEVMTAIADGDIPTVEEIMNLPAVNPEQNPDYNRVGDRGLAAALLSARESALRPGASDEAALSEMPWPEEVWKRFNDITWDDTKFHSWLFNNSGRLGLDQNLVRYIQRQGRENVNQGTYNAIKSQVDSRYSQRIRDAKNEEEADQLRADALRHTQRLTIAMYDDDISSTEDVMKVTQNWAEAEVASQIFKEYSKADPGRTNAAEQVAYDLMRGKYMGLTGIEEYASDVLQVQSLHEMMATDLYGTDQNGNSNILEIRRGNVGTPMEGRVTFRVQDKFDGYKEKWVAFDVVETDKGGLEEVAKELKGYDPYTGEIWDRALAVDLKSMADERSDAEADATAEARALALSGKTFSEIVEETGKTPEEVNNDLGPLAEVVVGAPIPAPQTNPTLDWYSKNVDGINIDAAALNARIVATAMPDAEQAVLFNSIYETIYTRMKRELLAETDSLGIYRSNGKLRRTAESTIAARISRYGLPNDYAEQVILDVFEGGR